MMRYGLLLLAAICTSAVADDCRPVDTAGGAVTFRVMQAGAPFTGAFRRYSGQVCFKQGRMTRIDVWLDPSSVDTGLPELDIALKDKEFFAVREFQRISFVSTSVQAQGDSRLARGTLEIKGRRREMDIGFRIQQGSGRSVVDGAFVLDRLQFGIGTGEWANTAWLGANVQVEFKAALADKK